MAVRLNSLFNPQSVLLIGASGLKNRDEVYSRKFTNLRQNLGTKAFVVDLGKKAGEMKIPKRADIAVLSISDKLVENALKILGPRALKYILITEDLLEDAEERIRTFARRRGIAVIGPSASPGILCQESGTAATVLQVTHPTEGFASVLCQDPVLGQLILKSSVKRGVGVSKFICMGKSDPELYLEMIKYFSADGKTRTICLQFSELKAGREFLENLKQAAATKPTVVAYTGDKDLILESALKQIGVTLISDVEKLLVVGTAVNFAPRMLGNRVAVVTNAPETASLIKLNLERAGLIQARPSSEILAKIAKRFSGVENGIVELPLGAGEDALKQSIKDMLQNPNVDAMLMVLDTERLSIAPKNFCTLVEKTEKPVIGAIIGWGEMILPKKEGGAVFLGSIEEAVETMKACLIFTKHQTRNK